MTLTCSVRGRPNTHTNLWWYYGSGDSLRGGGAGLSFPAGEGELRYAFGPGVTTYGNSRATSASMSAIYFTLPMDTGVKSCQVSGTFDQPPG
jgi:hypothetical protein